ncbi:hypothetical protein BH18THE2_BH18THE2_39130 [soil metagenome]
MINRSTSDIVDGATIEDWLSLKLQSVYDRNEHE